MTVKHDPTPWQLEGGHQWLSTTHPSPLFELVPVVGDEAAHKANAEFIVKACNAYEANQKVIEALKDELDAAREFVIRHPALSLIDLAEFRLFLKVPAAIDAAFAKQQTSGAA